MPSCCLSVIHQLCLSPIGHTLNHTQCWLSLSFAVWWVCSSIIVVLTCISLIDTAENLFIYQLAIWISSCEVYYLFHA